MFIHVYVVCEKQRENIYAHRLSVARGGIPGVEHVAGYAEHGRECRHPAEDVCPPGILVPQVRDWLPLHDIEEEHSLQIHKKRKKSSTKIIYTIG